jgi:hypothetical protein
MISQIDPYIWLDFLEESEREFDSFEQMCDFVATNFPRVVAHITSSSAYFLKKDTQEHLHVRVERLNLTFRFKFEDMQKGKFITVTKEIKLDQLLKDERFKGRVQRFSYETFKPNNYNLQRREYNTYTNMKGEVNEKEFEYDFEKVKHVIDFIHEVISSSNPDNFKYIMSWLSHIVCSPHRKTEIALFLHSNEKGTGKSSLGYFLKNYVFGNHISNVISGLSKLTQKHNTCVQRKIFTMVEELPSISGEFHSQFDSMKHIITDPYITIEPKGVDAYEIPNFVNLLLLSNNLMSLKLETGDRRYACFEVSPCRKGDEEYWENLHQNVLTEETGKHFYHYLKNLQKDEKVSLRKIPDTELRKELIQNSKPSHEQFFLDIQSGEEEINENMYLPEFIFKGKEVLNGITPDNLYRWYEVYCNKRKEPVLRRRLFVNSIKKFVEKGRTTTKERKYQEKFLVVS